MAWHRVLDAAAVPPGGVAAVDVVAADGGEAQLAVWRTVGGRLVACDARCPHQWSHLGYEGAVDGDELVCLAHHWRFDVDGSASKRAMIGRVDPKGAIAVHPVREVGGTIEVDLPGGDPS